MNLWLVTGVAIKAIGKNKLRSWLTVLGVVIGVAAVTAMVSLGTSATRLIEDQLYSLGTNVLLVVPETRTVTRQSTMLTPDDSLAIVRECSSIAAASPLVALNSHVSYGHFHRRPGMAGVGEDYLVIRNWPLAYGEFFHERDVHAAAKVCVLGQTVVVKLFQTRNPVGETIRIGNTPFRVIGVLASKGANLLGQDQDDLVLMPFSTVRKRLQGSNFDRIDSILVSARSAEETGAAQMQIRRLLDVRHNIAPEQPPHFLVADMKEYVALLDVIMTALTLTLAAIAGISLLVGGIGIMNIMLVSVTERTREIGIRMAVGASPRDILRQFLVEAVVLSSMGGAAGIAVGVITALAGTQLINTLMPNVELPPTISLSAAIIAMLFAAGVGVFFGYYPAWRASQLDPIEALRYE
jgi:putative ABC transport system permease protein